MKNDFLLESFSLPNVSWAENMSTMRAHSSNNMQSVINNTQLYIFTNACNFYNQLRIHKKIKSMYPYVGGLGVGRLSRGWCILVCKACHPGGRGPGGMFPTKFWKMRPYKIESEHLVIYLLFLYLHIEVIALLGCLDLYLAFSYTGVCENASSLQDICFLKLNLRVILAVNILL